MIYHDMAVYEDFERCANRLFEMVRDCARKFPGKPRGLFMDVQGHRNIEGGFDHDAWELMSEFIPNVLFPYLTEMSTPLLHARNGKAQREDVPDHVEFFPPLDGTQFEYDVLKSETRSRPEINSARATPPSVEQIADYLGLSDPCCLICWATPVERAHALPRALDGSHSLANFALLCKEHHREAPDVADAEAFWKWIDYASLRDSSRRMTLIEEKLKVPAPEPKSDPEPEKSEFFAKVIAELKALHEWKDDDFQGGKWGEILTEYYEVLHQKTGKHFGIEAKVSTHAWAMDIARRRISKNTRATDQGPVETALELVTACLQDKASLEELTDHCTRRLVPVLSDPRDAERVQYLLADLGNDRERALQILEVTVTALRPIDRPEGRSGP
ncbi:hypothetical protein BS329_26450 [Amycolatopsis coloradensis]|uniref:HNH nuclease domain-containing protein n=1 Tax=Amycolatopsis coloradensis TaxID=76021 RepID=A0A1R0KLB8_9PSEU|nr:hypothetical protein BS329_26450 [Amycolatopsis coloradensis]